MTPAPALRVRVQHRRTSKKYSRINPSDTHSLLAAKSSCIPGVGASVVRVHFGRWGSSLIGLAWGI